MARPIKDGVSYFPKDTDFYSDDKVRLLRAEFGAKGMYVLDYILCDLYGKNGYFMKWDKSKCFLVSDGAGCGCNPEFVQEFISGCFRCSFFDKRVYDLFGILTSRGIQRRYIRMFNGREEIQILREYWLLDEQNKKDVPTSVLSKVTFFSLETTENPDKTTENSDKTTENSQRKEKKNKEKENKKNKTLDPPSGGSFDDYRHRYSVEQLKIIDEFFSIIKHTRKSAKLADNVILKMYQSWEKYSVSTVVYALHLYNNSPNLHSKNENYVLGIIRNTTTEDIEKYKNKLNKQKGDENAITKPDNQPTDKWGLGIPTI